MSDTFPSATGDSRPVLDVQTLKLKLHAQAGARVGGSIVDIAALRADILDVVRSYVGGNLVTDAPLAKQGLDSLAAMELRQKLQARPA